MVENEAKIQEMKVPRITLKETILGVLSLAGHHTWKERWTKWKESWKTWRILWGEQIMWIILSTGLIPPLSHPSQIIPTLPSLKCLPWIHMMGRWPLRSHCHFQNNYASSRCSKRNYCKAFPTTLKGPAKVCFSKLPPNIISLSYLWLQDYPWRFRSSAPLMTRECNNFYNTGSWDSSRNNTNRKYERVFWVQNPRNKRGTLFSL